MASLEYLEELVNHIEDIAEGGDRRIDFERLKSNSGEKGVG